MSLVFIGNVIFRAWCLKICMYYNLFILPFCIFQLFIIFDFDVYFNMKLESMHQFIASKFIVLHATLIIQMNS